MNWLEKLSQRVRSRKAKKNNLNTILIPIRKAGLALPFFVYSSTQENEKSTKGAKGVFFTPLTGQRKSTNHARWQVCAVYTFEDTPQGYKQRTLGTRCLHP